MAAIRKIAVRWTKPVDGAIEVRVKWGNNIR